MRSPAGSSAILQGASDPPPAIAENEGAAAPYLLICDHAGRAIPACLDSLGLEAADLDRHIAWDIGAAAVAGAVARQLDAMLIRQAYSRLVIDVNRPPDKPDLIAAVADGTVIPGNAGLAPEHLRARLTQIHAPYHARIAAELDRRACAGLPARLVSVHSFTPVLAARARPWHLGVLHDGGSPAAFKMLDLLRSEPGLAVGDNAPYALDDFDYTIPRHAVARGLPYVEIEIRQDLIADAAGQARFAELIARLIPRAFD